MESAGAVVKTRGGGRGLGRRLGRGLRRAGRIVLDLLYPPVCLGCEAALADPDALCATCFRQLRPITPPFCPVLGIPFEADLGAGMRSAEAMADPPPFARARAAVLYNGMARRIVGQLKYGDRPELARFCARLMAAAGSEILGEDAVLVPVPLHRRRRLGRRYNQSAELARAVGALTGVAVAPGLLRRTRPTRQQVGLTAQARQRNVAGAFAVDAGAMNRLRGRRVVLVDDVVTTGATVKAATRALKRAGVARVDVLSFARVVIGADGPEAADLSP